MGAGEDIMISIAPSTSPHIHGSEMNSADLDRSQGPELIISRM